MPIVLLIKIYVQRHINLGRPTLKKWSLVLERVNKLE